MAEAMAQAFHDALLASKPDGAAHEGCPLCDAAREIASKEAGQVSDAERTFTEAEHLTLLTDRVQRETAAVTAEKAALEIKVSELQARVDVLDAEKAAATTERDNVRTEFDAFKSGVEQKAAVAERQGTRVTRVKAANASLPEEYFTSERTQRWAEMADEQFETFVSDLTDIKVPVAAGRETAAFTGGESPTAKPEGSVFGAFLSARHGGVPATKN